MDRIGRDLDEFPSIIPCSANRGSAMKLSEGTVNDSFKRVELRDYADIAGKEPALRFLVIGGHAVAAHGHSRSTFDMDFLVSKQDREEWRRRLENARFQFVSETAAFMQLTPPDASAGLDLMFVSHDTFEQFWAASEGRPFGTATARVPSLDHLLALKLHVLKQDLSHRTFKDAEDVEMLARRNKLNLEDARYEKLFLKYGTREIYETIKRVLRHS